jgi:hypothetical protein
MTRAFVTALAALATLALAVLAGCDRQPTDAAAPDPAAPVVDVQVMAFLSEARALHHEANVREDDADIPGALAAMDRLVRATRPHAGQRVPEVEEVLADAWARSAELQLKKHDLDSAKKAVAEGLSHAPEPTYFRGHLLEVEGIVEEAVAADYADAGNKDEAQKARAHAIALLREAVGVQEQVIGKALGDGGKR